MLWNQQPADSEAGEAGDQPKARPKETVKNEVRKDLWGTEKAETPAGSPESGVHACKIAKLQNTKRSLRPGANQRIRLFKSCSSQK